MIINQSKNYKNTIKLQSRYNSKFEYSLILTLIYFYIF
jgi:hypothetical protein